MKKILLIISFLASQLFAVQCTEEEYKPYFDKNSDRYIFLGFSINGNMVFDKNSVIYDKENQIIKVWVINQTLKDPKAGTDKVYLDFNIKNNQIKFHNYLRYSCEGEIILTQTESQWANIIPGSAGEDTFNKLKEYLKIK